MLSISCSESDELWTSAKESSSNAWNFASIDITAGFDFKVTLCLTHGARKNFQPPWSDLGLLKICLLPIMGAAVACKTFRGASGL